MIRVEHLSKNFGELQVLRDVNVEIKKGEVISIIGTCFPHENFPKRLVADFQHLFV